MQRVKVTYETDPKTGKKTKIAEKTFPMEKYNLEDISAEEFNDDTTKASTVGKAAAAAAKAAMKKKQQQNGK